MNTDWSEEDIGRFEEEYEEAAQQNDKEKNEFVKSINQKLTQEGTTKTFTFLYNNSELTFNSFYDLNKNQPLEFVTVMRYFLIGDRIRTTYKKETVTGVVTGKINDSFLSELIVHTDQDLDKNKKDHTLYCPIVETRDPIYFEREPENGYKKYQQRQRRQTKKELILSWIENYTLPF